jgi:hypothetical protein
MVKDDSDMEGNSVRASRVQKAQRFMRERAAYMCDFIRAAQLLIARAERMKMLPCIRPNWRVRCAWRGVILGST